MKVENKENNRKIQQVAATMAIEDMYMSKDCLQGLMMWLMEQSKV